jgi:hypothetical protein
MKNIINMVKMQNFLIINKRFVSSKTSFDENNQNAAALTRHHERLEETEQGLINNVNQLDHCNKQIDSIQDEMCEKLDPTIKSELNNTTNKHHDNLENLTKTLENEKLVSNSGVNQLDIRKEIIDSKITHSEHIKNVLDKSEVSIPEDKRELYDNLKNNRDQLAGENSELVEQQRSNMTDYYDFSYRVFGSLLDRSGPTGPELTRTSSTDDNVNSRQSTPAGENANPTDTGSLVDDYGNPNIEQPSHMDSDD